MTRALIDVHRAVNAGTSNASTDCLVKRMKERWKAWAGQIDPRDVYEAGPDTRLRRIYKEKP